MAYKEKTYAPYHSYHHHHHRHHHHHHLILNENPGNYEEKRSKLR
jgi:hypothetical protein